MTYFVDFDRTIFDTDSFKKEYGTIGGIVFRPFKPGELQKFIYPDAQDFLRKHAADVVIVTYAIREYAHVKVLSSLAEFPVKEIHYTILHKGRLLKRLTKKFPGPFKFIDDAAFQLASVSATCAHVECIEIRRDPKPAHGRWPAVRSFAELSK